MEAENKPTPEEVTPETPEVQEETTESSDSGDDEEEQSTEASFDDLTTETEGDEEVEMEDADIEDMFAGTGYTRAEFEERLKMLEKNCTENEPETLNDETEIVMQIFDLKGAALLAVLMNRNVKGLHHRLNEAQVNLQMMTSIMEKSMQEKRTEKRSPIILPR